MMHQSALSLFFCCLIVFSYRACKAQHQTFVTVQKNNADLVSNFLCWASRNRDGKVVFVPLDEESSAKLAEMAVSNVVVPRRFTGSSATVTPYRLALEMMKETHDTEQVVITSADNLMLSNPFNVVNASCLHTLSTVSNFLHLKTCDKSISLLEAVVQCISADKLSDTQCKAMVTSGHQFQTCFLDGALQSNFLDVFVSQAPQKKGVFPSMIDLSGVNAKQALSFLQNWNLQLEDHECKPPPDKVEECVAKSNPFRLTIRVLTMDRVESLRRAINSLKKANYDGDSVDLEVMVDFPKEGSTDEHKKVVKYVTYGLQWPHGNVTKLINTEPGGIVKQWIKKLDSENEGHVYLLLEDDLEVSEHFYTWSKAAVSFYLLNCSTYRPSLLGLSLERQHETLGHGRLFWLPEKNPDWITQAHAGSGAVYATQKDSSWAPIVFPHNWNAFVSWFWSKGVNENPCLYGLYSNKWHFDTPGRIWTPWLHKFVFENGLFTLYFNYGIYDHEWVPKSLVRNHRETGLHFNATKAKALHRWQPFLDFEPKVGDYNLPEALVYTDFFQKRVADVSSLHDRWRLLSNVDDQCYYFDFDGVAL